MAFIASLIGLLVLCGFGACIWQHRRYLKARREIVQDQTPMLYPGRTFHAVIFLKVEHGKDVIEAVRALRPILESSGGGKVVYAGQAGLALVRSEQLSSDWDAVLLVQYESRAVFDAACDREEQREALANFEEAYIHGFQRSAFTNLMLHQALLGLRLADILRRAPSNFPFVPAGEAAFPRLKQKVKEMEGLDSLRHLSEDAVLVFNLIRPGDTSQRSADRSYTRSMMSAMAERAHGPMHLGRAVTVEGEAKFSRVAAVYYPGIDHMHAMISSTFMNRIGEGKQLGDSLAVATVPFLSKL